MGIIGIILAAAIFLIVLDKFYGTNWHRNLTVYTKFTKNEVSAGDCLELVEEIANDKWLVLPVITVKFQLSKKIMMTEETSTHTTTDWNYQSEVFTLGGRQKIIRKIPLLCPNRGVYTLDKIDAVSKGLFFRDMDLISFIQPQTVIVYPQCRYMDFVSEVGGMIYGDMKAKIKVYDDPCSFAGVREYNQQDPMKNINWKAAARSGQLMTNIREYIAGMEVIILLNIENSGVYSADDVKEAEISLACGMAEKMLSLGVSTGLVAENLYIPMGKGLAHWDSIRYELADFTYTGKETEFYKKVEELDIGESSDTVMVLISENHEDTLQKAYESMAINHAGSVWIAPVENNKEKQWWENSRYNCEGVISWAYKNNG